MKRKQAKFDGQDSTAGDASALPPLPACERRSVAYGLVAPDPEQPRKEFAQGKLEELAESIRRQGVLQELILELVPARYRLVEPDLVNKNWRVEYLAPSGEIGLRCEDTEEECRLFLKEQASLDTGRNNALRADPLEAYYKIVCGERRWRAAGIAGLAELPAKVYLGALSREQRFAMQWVENEQRENITALEEAAALAKQLEERKRLDASFSPEKLAAEIGVSRAGMYEKLKLNRLQPAIREALLAGTISVSIAGEIAKLPTLKLQTQLLATVAERAKFRPVSVRDIQEEIEEEYVKNLSEAPFDAKSEFCFEGVEPAVMAHLAVGTFVGTCVNCPQRTGNMVAEFPELSARPNLCTNPGCFGEKCRAHWQREAQDLAQEGKTVLTEKEFKSQKGKYIAGDKHEYTQNKSGTFEVLMGKHAPEPVLVATAEGLEKYYPKEEAVAAARKNGVKFNRNPAATKEDEAKEKEKREAAQKLHDARCQLAGQLVEAAAKGINGMSDKEAWRLLAERGDHGWGPFNKALKKHAKGDRGLVLAGALTSHLMHPADWQTGKWDQDALALWKALGVDLEAEEAKRAPKPELPLVTEAKQKEIFDHGLHGSHGLPAGGTKKRKGLSPSAKARIVAAQRLRWAKVKAAQGKS